MSVPYSPAAFATPAINPTFASKGVHVPYISNSDYAFQPISLGTTDLIPQSSSGAPSNSQAQEQALADQIYRASDMADRIMFGASAATSRSTLRAQLNVEADEVRLVNGWLKLVCDVKPITEVRGVDVGLQMGQLNTIGPNLASAIRIGRRTIYVPYAVPYIASNMRSFVEVVDSSKLTVVWSYVGGFPHSSLAANTLANASTLTLTPVDGGTGLYGIYPGTVMRINDDINSENFTVQTVVNNVITTVNPLVNAHTMPPAPDFLTVTAIPPGVQLAVVYLVNALMKTRGDGSISLEEITEPRRRNDTTGDLWPDLKMARKLLLPWTMRIKNPR